MVRAYYDSEPKRISYMPLPDGRADIRLCVNVEFVDDEDGGRWECDENYFRADMTREYVVQHFDELLDYVPPEPEEEPKNGRPAAGNGSRSRDENLSDRNGGDLMTTYVLCKKLAAIHKLTAEMLDVFFAAGRITAEQYQELLGMI